MCSMSAYAHGVKVVNRIDTECTRNVDGVQEGASEASSLLVYVICIYLNFNP